MTRPPCTAAASLRVEAPDVAGPLAVFPVLGPPADLEFRAFAEAAALGVVVEELAPEPSVSDLRVVNPLDLPVLLYEGEEVRGAQQDRTLDLSVLVPPQATVEVPVSCVEAGRWDLTRSAEALAPAPQAAFPELRRAKSLAARATGRADQREVWDIVGTKAARHGARSETGALQDVFAAREEALAELCRQVRRRDGQLGAVAAIGGQVRVLDLAGRADVFAALHGPLVAGYALDAVERLDADAPTRAGAVPPLEAVQGLLEEALTAQGAAGPSVGLGDRRRFAAARCEGARLEVGGELAALTAFPAERPKARVARPSRRR